jgi:hypothetical protein
MKVWSDVSTIAKLALLCLIAGFCLGIWASAAVGNLNEPPTPTPAAIDH